MKVPTFALSAIAECLFLVIKRYVSPSTPRRNSENHFYWSQVLRDLARILITKIAKVRAPENKKNAPAAGESGNQTPKRRKDKLIRLNDLIPKQDVTGGQRLLFGATDTTQSTNNPTKDK
jgi:hypothetical protein